MLLIQSFIECYRVSTVGQTRAQLAQAWKKRALLREASLNRHRERLIHSVRMLMPQIKEVPGLKRLWLLGSVAWGGFHERSDIDVAVEGVGERDYWSLIGIIERAVDVPVQVIRVEEIDSGFRTRIVNEGLELYGSK